MKQVCLKVRVNEIDLSIGPYDYSLLANGVPIEITVIKIVLVGLVKSNKKCPRISILGKCAREKFKSAWNHVLLLGLLAH
jgi:hypothetical protein